MSRDLIDGDLLRATVHETADRLTKEPHAGRMRPWVAARLEGDVRGVVRFEQYGSSYEFRSDESVDRGGQGTAPSPMRYLLSAIAFCLQGWCAKTLALLGESPESLGVTVRTLLDMRGEHHVAGVEPHPPCFVLDVDASGPVPGGALVSAVVDARDRCPVTSLVAAAVPLYLVVRHDGAVIHDERPPDLRNEHEEVLTR